MSWTAPHTAVSNEAVTAAFWNASIRDNLAATEASLGTIVGDYFVATGTNVIAHRRLKDAVAGGYSSTSSTTYTDIDSAGPSVSAETGTTALVFIAAEMSSATTDTAIYCSFDISGATTIAAANTWCIERDGMYGGMSPRWGSAHLVTGLTAGTNIFTMKYRVSSAVGTFGKREIGVLPF